MEASFWFGLSYISPVCRRGHKRSPVNMMAVTAECRMITMLYHKLTSKKEGMTECCRDNDGARAAALSSQMPIDPVQRE